MKAILRVTASQQLHYIDDISRSISKVQYTAHAHWRISALQCRK